jgi:hypothetical protein
MANIHGELVFGVKIKVESPLVPDKKMTDFAMKVVEQKATEVLRLALSTIQIIPGLKFSISDAKTSIKVMEIEP